MLKSLRLAKKHEHSGALVGQDLESLFLWTVGDGQPVTGMVVGRFAIQQQHVMMRAVALDLVQGDVPGIQYIVALERDPFPARERADDLDCSRFCLARRKAPPKYLRKRLLPVRGPFALRRSSLKATRTGINGIILPDTVAAEKSAK
jgi:hypothetical protein